jgi:hypothetical protein
MKGITAQSFHFFVYLRAAELIFVVAGAIIVPITASTDTGAKDSGRGGVDVTGQVTGVGSAFVRDPPVQVETSHTREASVLKVCLVLGHTRSVDRSVGPH